MTHDPNVYDAPYEFRPERYYDATGNLNNDDIVLTFGFGRRCVLHAQLMYNRLINPRVCPGRYMAEAQVRVRRPNDSFHLALDLTRGFLDLKIWYALTCLVSTFNLGPAIDDSGNAIPMAVEYTDTTVS